MSRLQCVVRCRCRPGPDTRLIAVAVLAVHDHPEGTSPPSRRGASRGAGTGTRDARRGRDRSPEALRDRPMNPPVGAGQSFTSCADRGEAMSEPTTHAIDVPGAVLTYDVREPATPSEHRPLFVFGSPMAASGFSQLVSNLDDRTVITYDPRVSERSKLEAGAEVSYEVHGDDVHRVVEATGLGPVDVFASSGGAVAALPWLLAHPDEVGTVVAHEPPLSALLEDREMLDRVLADIAA